MPSRHRLKQRSLGSPGKGSLICIKLWQVKTLRDLLQGERPTLLSFNLDIREKAACVRRPSRDTQLLRAERVQNGGSPFYKKGFFRGSKIFERVWKTTVVFKDKKLGYPPRKDCKWEKGSLWKQQNITSLTLNSHMEVKWEFQTKIFQKIETGGKTKISKCIGLQERILPL